MLEATIALPTSTPCVNSKPSKIIDSRVVVVVVGGRVVVVVVGGTVVVVVVGPAVVVVVVGATVVVVVVGATVVVVVVGGTVVVVVVGATVVVVVVAPGVPNTNAGSPVWSAENTKLALCVPDGMYVRGLPCESVSVTSTLSSLTLEYEVVLPVVPDVYIAKGPVGPTLLNEKDTES
jgi:hypothetical protein